MSDVIDIVTYRPERTDKIFVDTNVWFWFTYASSNEMCNADAPRRYQIEKYPQFIEKVLDKGATLYHCPLSYSELAHLIETIEYKRYVSKVNHNVSKKEFRRIPEEREKVLKEIFMAWQGITSVSECIPSKLDKGFVDDVHNNLNNSILDPYDAFLCQIMIKEGFSHMLTDDSDFFSTDSIVIYTANNKMLN
ncbi:PIN domain-containing protein [Shewanella sp. AS16]|uniref:PIN domain-containing protein n=1 Tax=Shewanella sp. AS16 TaxID=2907625 RepID=UPI001F26A69E|nr:PIN domain-containing protein [Shewanella sp. AS16]MCE9686029.1 PIN domain-containing protein [Shewanella sp. AS16]